MLRFIPANPDARAGEAAQAAIAPVLRAETKLTVTCGEWRITRDGDEENAFVWRGMGAGCSLIPLDALDTLIAALAALRGALPHLVHATLPTVHQ